MSLQMAFIGTGAMGAPVARRLLQAGHGLRVYDPRQQAASALERDGAQPAVNAAHAAAGADIVFTCLPHDAALREVYFGPEGLVGDFDRLASSSICPPPAHAWRSISADTSPSTTWPFSTRRSPAARPGRPPGP